MVQERHSMVCMQVDWGKGRALAHMLVALGLDEAEDVIPIYLGDDRTDEDAFKVLKERSAGLGILISSKVCLVTKASSPVLPPTSTSNNSYRMSSASFIWPTIPRTITPDLREQRGPMLSHCMSWQQAHVLHFLCRQVPFLQNISDVDVLLCWRW